MFWKKRKEKDKTKIISNIVTEDVLYEQMQANNTTYHRSEYDRKIYDDPKAKQNAKDKFFGDKKTGIDPYTGKILYRTQEEAKKRFGDKWQDHVAESDHINALKEIYDKYGKNPFLTDEDLKSIANKEHNISVTSRKFNNQKREKTNKEFAKKANIPDKGKKKAIQDQNKSQILQAADATGRTIKNAAEIGHNAGMEAGIKSAQYSTAISGIDNIVRVFNGEETVDEALVNVTESGARGFATKYIQDGSAEVMIRAFSTSKSPLIQKMLESNVPAKVITTVTTFGSTVTKYIRGEITTEECLIDVGDKGLSLATSPVFMAVGGALIPIPVVGEAIGLYVGSILTEIYYNSIVDNLVMNKYEHEERMRIIAECEAAKQELIRRREQLEEYIDQNIRELKDCFKQSMEKIYLGFENGDADLIIEGANGITQKMGGKVNYNNVEEYKKFLLDENSTFIL